MPESATWSQPCFVTVGLSFQPRAARAADPDRHQSIRSQSRMLLFANLSRITKARFRELRSTLPSDFNMCLRARDLGLRDIDMNSFCSST